jgi:hypothetical protein
MEKLRNRLVNARRRGRQNEQTEDARVVLRFILREERGIMVKRRFPRKARGHAAPARRAA